MSFRETSHLLFLVYIVGGVAVAYPPFPESVSFPLKLTLVLTLGPQLFLPCSISFWCPPSFCSADLPPLFLSSRTESQVRPPLPDHFFRQALFFTTNSLLFGLAALCQFFPFPSSPSTSPFILPSAPPYPRTPGVWAGRFLRGPPGFESSPLR